MCPIQLLKSLTSVSPRANGAPRDDQQDQDNRPGAGHSRQIIGAQPQAQSHTSHSERNPDGNDPPHSDAGPARGPRDGYRFRRRGDPWEAIQQSG